MKTNHKFTRWLAGVAVACASLLSLQTAQAAGGGYPLDTFPVSKLTDLGALQDGARTFVNYCLNCHSAKSMRYNRMHEIGLNDEQIKNNLLFASPTVGSTMTITMRPQDAKAWFGALPPDLSVITRARASADGSGSDWVYTYLRSYYRDASRPTGWNNAVFPAVGMPHIFWELQGSRGAVVEEVMAAPEGAEGGKHGGMVRKVVNISPEGLHSEKVEPLPEGSHAHPGVSLQLTEAVGGTLTAAQFDEKIANLVAFLTYVSDPTAKTRVRIGIWVMFFLVILSFFAWRLNREYWKDIR